MFSLEPVSTSAVAAGMPILAQISASPNQVMTVLYGGVSIMGAVYLAIMLFRAIFPPRLPPIGEELAKMATKQELIDSLKAVQAQISADIAQHDSIKDAIRREVKDDLASVHAVMTTSLQRITDQIGQVVIQDEERARNAHKRIDGIVTKVSEMVGKMEIIQQGGGRR